MGHIVLLGDSIFDNGAYVSGGPDVVQQLRERLPSGWRATLGAIDGSVTTSVARQLDRLPSDASHLIVSVGGNDARGHVGTQDGARSMAEALDRLAGFRDQFERDYRAMLEGVLEQGLRTAVCTIYDARFPDPLRRRRAATGLTIFSDCIAREAFSRALPLIDLPLICDEEEEDFANPIEPFVRGGAKIAAGIAALVAEHVFARHRSEVFAW